MRFRADFAVNIREVRQYGNSVIVMTLHSAYDAIDSYDRVGQEIGGQLAPPAGHGAEGYRVTTREALKVKRSRPSIGTGTFGRQMSYDALRAVNIIVGSPDSVITTLTEIIAHLNPGYLHMYANEGPMPHEDVMRSIELWGREVVPALHEIPLQPYAA